MRFYDAAFDAAPLFVDAQPKAEVLMHILGTLLRGWDVTAGADGLRTPILVAHGRHDYIVPWELWKDVVGALPSATLKVFEKSGHQPFCEEPAEFAQVVDAWMNGTRPRQ